MVILVSIFTVQRQQHQRTFCGAAITSLVSLLIKIPVNNKVCLDEIDLNECTYYGDRDIKRKTGGCETILCPKQNHDDLEI